MNNEDNIYHKCGEIYFSKKGNYTFLCYYCNNLFYEFTEFKTHNLLHTDTVHSSEEINFIRNDNQSFNTNLVKRNYFESLGSNCNDNMKSDVELFKTIDDLQFNENFVKSSYNKPLGISCDDDMKDDIEHFNDINGLQCNENEIINSSIETIKIEKMKSFDNNLTSRFNNGLCKHCKIFVKLDLHDFKKCSKIQQTIMTYKGDFIKLLREGILCCYYCKRYFEDYKNLYEHHIDAKHCIRKNKCKICRFFTFMNTKIQSSKQDLYILSDYENKCRSSVQESFKINCEECSIDFYSQAKYNLHLKTIHEITIGNESETDTIEKHELLLKCTLCEKVFKTKYQKQIHMRIHNNERPYKCELCSAAFTVATNLKNHIIYKHTKDRPFVCDYEGCNVKFKLFNLKKQHEKIHLPANFQCEMCGNYYKSKFILLKHQQSRHVDAENWANRCEICNKRFAHPEYLVDHKRIHTGEKPFGCDVCSKFFRKRSSLREHKKLHSDTRKYICRFCGKGFKQVAGYWGHMKRHPTIS